MPGKPAPGDHRPYEPPSEDVRQEPPAFQEPQESADPPSPDDTELALAVRSKLTEQPGFLTGTVDLEVMAGVVILRGEARHVETIAELERRAGAVTGVQEVRNLLHLPGEEPPLGDQKQ